MIADNVGIVNGYEVFDKDGVEICINIETGEAFTSVSGYARLSGKGTSTIFNRLARQQENDVTSGDGIAPETADTQGFQPIEKMSHFKVFTKGGQQTARFVDENFIAEWLPLDNPKRASDLLRFGIRKFLYQMAGYKQPSTSGQDPISPAESIQSAIAAAKTMKTILTTWVAENPDAATILKEMMPDLPISITVKAAPAALPTEILNASQVSDQTQNHSQFTMLVDHLKLQSFKANSNRSYDTKSPKVIDVLELDFDCIEALSIAYKWAITRMNKGLSVNREAFCDRARNDRSSIFLRKNKENIWVVLEYLLVM